MFEPKDIPKVTVAKVLLIESKRANASSFTHALEKKGIELIRKFKLDDAIACVRDLKPDVVVLDAASMRTSGARMCRALQAKLDGIPLILISPQGNRPITNGASHAVLTHPITARKLTNRVARFLPAQDKDVIRAGPILLDNAHRMVHCNGNVKHLTPQLMKLLRVLLKQNGKVVSRKELMRKVWRTTYMGDTRTLDAHISWLRKAIEPEPKSPQYIKTIRGVGYRLDLPKTEV